MAEEQDKNSMDNYVPRSLGELGFDGYDKFRATVMDRECGLVEWKNEHGVFMVSPAIKVEALKDKIAKWVEKRAEQIDESDEETTIQFRVIHRVAGCGVECAVWDAEVVDCSGLDHKTWKIYGGDGPTELAALEALDTDLSPRSGREGDE